MTINLKVPDVTELKPRITVFGVGGAGGNAVNNMIRSGLEGVQFVVANTDAQALAMSSAERRVQMGTHITEGLGAGSKPDIGASAAEEAIADIKAQLAGSHMVFVTAGMGGGTGTGAAPIIARASHEEGILTVGVVTRPFQFEGQHRMDTAIKGIAELEKHVDTLLVIPNQNLFRVATEKTTFSDAFAMADQVLHSGVACITDLMVKEGLINLDFADVKTVMHGMGKAMMGTGESSGEQRAMEAAEAAISNPLLDDVSMMGATGLLISITGGNDLTLYEVDEAASRIREEVDASANIILGATFDQKLDGKMRVSVVATGLEDQKARAARQDRPAAAGQAAQAARATGSPEQDKAVANLTERIARLGHNADAGQSKDQDQARPAAGKDSRKDAEGQAWKGPQDVTIEKRPPQTPLQPSAAAQKKPAETKTPFVPQPPSMAKQSPRRMPNVEDFPPVAQKEMKARKGESPETGLQAQKKKVGFFERLTGLRSARKEEPEIMRDKEPTLESPDKATEKSTEKAPEKKGVDTQTESAARRPASGQAPASRARITRDAGTAKPSPKQQVAMQDEDADLEIPAFLKRQAN